MHKFHAIIRALIEQIKKLMGHLPAGAKERNLKSQISNLRAFSYGIIILKNVRSIKLYTKILTKYVYGNYGMECVSAFTLITQLKYFTFL